MRSFTLLLIALVFLTFLSGCESAESLLEDIARLKTARKALSAEVKSLVSIKESSQRDILETGTLRRYVELRDKSGREPVFHLTIRLEPNPKEVPEGYGLKRAMLELAVDHEVYMGVQVGDNLENIEPKLKRYVRVGSYEGHSYIVVKKRMEKRDEPAVPREDKGRKLDPNDSTKKGEGNAG